MSLIDDIKEPCVMMDKLTVSDGLGGFTTRWTDGATFDAAIVKDRTLAARVAEKQGVSEVYTVTVARNLQIGYHDVFRRLSDGAAFRVTSNITDSVTPPSATFSFGQVIAERWEIA